MTQYQFTSFLLSAKFSVPIEAKLTNDDIVKWEYLWQIKLPLAYKEFLLICGKNLGNSFLMTNFSIDEYPNMWQIIREELIITKSSFSLTKDIFVFAEFLEHGKFWFFRLSEGDDPPVYSYIESDLQPKIEYEKFTDCIKNQSWYKNRIWGN
jgi:hypothetical protein